MLTRKSVKLTTCQFCNTSVSTAAKKCPNCSSNLEEIVLAPCRSCGTMLDVNLFLIRHRHHSIKDGSSDYSSFVSQKACPNCGDLKPIEHQQRAVARVFGFLFIFSLSLSLLYTSIHFFSAPSFNFIGFVSGIFIGGIFMVFPIVLMSFGFIYIPLAMLFPSLKILFMKKDSLYWLPKEMRWVKVGSKNKKR